MKESTVFCPDSVYVTLQTRSNILDFMLANFPIWPKFLSLEKKKKSYNWKSLFSSLVILQTRVTILYSRDNPRDGYISEEGRITPLYIFVLDKRCAGNFECKLQQY